MAGNLYFYPVINKLWAEHSDVIPDLREAGSLEIAKWLENNVVDIGLCILDCIYGDSFAMQKLLDVELRFFVHKKHPLATKHSLEFSDLASHNVCLLHEDSYQNVLLKQKFAEAKVPLNVMMYSSQLNSIYTMLSYGNCGAFLFDGMCDDPSLVGISMSTPIFLSLGVVWNVRQPEYRAVDIVRKYLIHYFKKA